MKRNIPLKYWIPVYGILLFTFTDNAQCSERQEFYFLIYHCFASVGLVGYFIGYYAVIIISLL